MARRVNLKTIAAQIGGMFKGRQTVPLSAFGGGKAEYLPVNYETIVRQGYRKNEIIFACVEKKAKTASQVRLLVVDKDGNPLPEHPLQKLIKRPNPTMTEYEFWRTINANGDLAGDCYFEIERSRSGKPVNLWWLRPDWVLPINSDDRRRNPDGIAHYEYRAPGKDVTILKKTDVLVFSEYDPLNERRGWPRAAVASRVGEADNETTDLIMKLMQDGGVPNGILKTKRKLKDADVEDIRRKWIMRYGGMSKAMKGPAVLDMEAEYQQIQLDMQKMNMRGLDERAEVRICEVMDVPPVIIGALIGLLRSTYDNVREAQKLWWHNTLIPLYEHLDDQIMLKLAPQFGDDDIQLKWDFTKVPALQEDVKEIWDRARYVFTDGLVKINEARQMIGLPPDEENGDKYVWQVQQTIEDTLSTDDVDSESDSQSNAGKPDGSSARKSDSEDDDDILTYGSKAHIAYMERKDAQVAPFEKRIKAQAKKEFQRQLDAINEKLEGLKSLPDTDELFPLDDEIAAWLAAFDEMIREAIESIGQDELSALGGEEFAIDRPEVVAAIEEVLNTLATDTNNTTYAALIEVIQEAEEAGDDVTGMQERINLFFEGRMKPYETERIARTTMTQANTKASLEAWDQAEIVIEKTWMSELRMNTREAHRKAHGQTVGLRERFDVGGEKLDGPGDPKGRAENIINCICRMVPKIREEE